MKRIKNKNNPFAENDGRSLSKQWFGNVSTTENCGEEVVVILSIPGNILLCVCFFFKGGVFLNVKH